MDTIFALASARGKAGVSVIRVSGPAALSAADELAGGGISPRRATLRTLHDPTGAAIDDALVLTFPGPASFTGEHVVEFHTHGSVAVVSAVLRVLSEMDGLRLAEPGEFTRRAFENERLDLAQVEGLGDLIEAETEAQRVQALRLLSGALGERAGTWREKLVRAAALLTATIDFADEEVPVDVGPEVSDLIGDVLSALQAEIAGSRISERIRDGFEVAIVGAPNVGKSTLLNALAGRDAAITSEIAGTTRDVIEVRMDLDGYPVTLLDTAGLHDTVDPIESIGVRRAAERAAAADLRVFLVLPGERPPEGIPIIEGDIVVRAKADLHTGHERGISGMTGEGIGDLIEAIGARLAERSSGAATAVTARHRAAMRNAVGALEATMAELGRNHPETELAAENLHTALRALDALTGRVDVEHVLDVVFASFCLGK